MLIFAAKSNILEIKYKRIKNKSTDNPIVADSVGGWADRRNIGTVLYPLGSLST